MKADTYTGSLTSLKKYWEEKGRTRSLEKDYSIRLEGIKQIVNEISTYLRGQLVLDIGCGPGIAASLFPVGSRIIGLDFSISMLRNARSRIRHLVQGNALNLPIRSCSFNVVTCLFVVSDYSHKITILSEAHRVLQENGFLLFSDYSLQDEHWKFKRTIRPLMGDRCNIFLKHEGPLSNDIRKAGFKVQEVKHVQFHALFKLERYVKSEQEMKQLKTKNLDLWNDVQRCIRNEKINREFILIIGTR
jgi:ubiquinone/menaquinone biosynthesis C-methylase UbiE